MKFLINGAIFVAAGLAIAAGVRAGHSPQRNTFPAPTYYLAAEVNACDLDSNYIEFRGASNLPPGAIVTAAITDFNFDAWTYYSDKVFVAVNEEGVFSGKISPTSGMRVKHNLILQALFATFLAKQPPSVLAIVGKKGEFLAGVQNPQEHLYELVGRSINPQLYQVSGWFYGLETIARVPNCGEHQK